MAIAGRGGLYGKRGALGQAEVRRRVLEGTGMVQDQTRRSLWAGSRRVGLKMIREEWSDISKARGDGQRQRDVSWGAEEAEMDKDGEREERWLEMVRESQRMGGLVSMGRR